jgi:hypothetical protein
MKCKSCKQKIHGISDECFHCSIGLGPKQFKTIVKAGIMTKDEYLSFLNTYCMIMKEIHDKSGKPEPLAIKPYYDKVCVIPKDDEEYGYDVDVTDFLTELE